MGEIDFAVAVRVKQERLRLGFSPAHMAGALGISVNDYLRREAGSERFGAQELQRLLETLNRDPAWLYR